MLRATRGYFVPELCLTLDLGLHSSPGFAGVYPGRMQSRPALILAILAQANNPRRLVQFNDDSLVDSCACPYPALLDEVFSSRIQSCRLLSPLCGCDGQSLPQGTGISPTPGREESHLHTDQVIKDQIDLSRLSPAVFEGLRFQTNESHLNAIVRRGLGKVTYACFFFLYFRAKL